MKKWFAFPSLLLLAGCSGITVLDPKSTTGKEQAFLIWFGLAIMMFVLVIVFALMIWIVIKYRERKDPQPEPKQVKDIAKYEWIWIIGPVILLAVLAVPTVSITYDQSPKAQSQETENQDGVHIQVLAKQFEWTFSHEGGGKDHNILYLPEGEDIVLHLSASDVIHSFWVPHLAGKVDLIPGEDIVYEIKNPEIGTYKGKCAEYCGIQHANMTFEARVIPKSEYEEYVEKRASGSDS